MRILMLTWEYPPRIVGGIARHVEELAWALAKRPDYEIHVVTCDFPGAAAEETIEGVHVHRVTPYDAPGGYNDFVHWVHQLNAAMRDRAYALIRGWLAPKTKTAAQKDPKKLSERDGILLHAHDWLAYFAAVELKYAFKLPLVSTIHATEFGRNNGIHNDLQRYINRTEEQLAHESWRVIVCSDFMRGEVTYALHAPQDKLDVIYNGINASKFDFSFSADEAADFRTRFAAQYEKIAMFVGRGVREKGSQVLIDALPIVRQSYLNCKVVIAGGGDKRHLVDQAYRLGIGPQVLFTGFLSDDELLRLYKVADVACFPSLYEPFGIVALEAMAARTPVVVSEAGGLKEVVEHDVTGTVTYIEDPHSLAWGILRVLNQPGHAYQMAQVAYDRVRSIFNWDRIAMQTESIYARIWRDYKSSNW